MFIYILDNCVFGPLNIFQTNINNLHETYANNLINTLLYSPWFISKLYNLLLFFLMLIFLYSPNQLLLLAKFLPTIHYYALTDKFYSNYFPSILIQLLHFRPINLQLIILYFLNFICFLTSLMKFEIICKIIIFFLIMHSLVYIHL